MTTFREAMDLLGISAADAGEMFGVAPQTVRQMRLDPSSANYRTPPADWREQFAELARQRGGEMAQLARELSRPGGSS